MSWIDIFLSEGDPHRVYGADAETALSHFTRVRDLPRLWLAYRRAGLPLMDQLAFLVLDLVRSERFQGVANKSLAVERSERLRHARGKGANAAAHPCREHNCTNHQAGLRSGGASAGFRR